MNGEHENCRLHFSKCILGLAKKNGSLLSPGLIYMNQMYK